MTFALQLPLFASGGWGNLFSVLGQHLWVLTVLFLLSWPTRTVSLRSVVLHFFVGVYPVALSALLAGHALLWLTDVLSIPGLAETLLVPAFEELAKVIPVVIYFGLSARRRGLRVAAIDGLILGFAVGAGFAFHEDMAASRSVGRGLSLDPLGLLLPTAAKIGGGFVGPPARWVAGHAGWAALSGLSVGLCAHVRRRSWSGFRNWRLPAVGVALVVLDHANVNYQGTGDVVLNRLFLGGLLVPIVLGVLVTVVLLVDGTAIRDGRPAGDPFPSIPRSTQLALLPPRSLAQLLELRAVRGYQRLRRSAHLSLWHWRRDPPPKEVAIEALAEVAAVGVVASAWAEDPGGRPDSNEGAPGT